MTDDRTVNMPVVPRSRTGGALTSTQRGHRPVLATWPRIYRNGKGASPTGKRPCHARPAGRRAVQGVYAEFWALGVPRPPAPYTAETDASAQLPPSMLPLSSAGFLSSRLIPFWADVVPEA